MRLSLPAAVLQGQRHQSPAEWQQKRKERRRLSLPAAVLQAQASVSRRVAAEAHRKGGVSHAHLQPPDKRDSCAPRNAKSGLDQLTQTRPGLGAGRRRRRRTMRTMRGRRWRRRRCTELGRQGRVLAVRLGPAPPSGVAEYVAGARDSHQSQCATQCPLSVEKIAGGADGNGAREPPGKALSWTNQQWKHNTEPVVLLETETATI